MLRVHAPAAAAAGSAPAAAADVVASAAAALVFLGAILGRLKNTGECRTFVIEVAVLWP